MNGIKNVLGRLFALWALLIFVSSILIVALLCWIIGWWPEPKSSKMSHVVFEVWMGFFFFMTGVRRTYKGREHFEKGQNYIVVCNHNTYVDVLMESPATPGPNKTIAKTEMARIPIFGVVYKRGSVLVDRKSEESRKKSYLQMKDVLLKLGLHMCIYPEGTRNKTGAPLQRFHDGAFRLAVDTQKPIIPSLIFNTKKVLPLHKTFYFWPHPVEMHFLPPVYPNGKDKNQLKEEVFDIMYRHYVEHNESSVQSSKL